MRCRACLLPVCGDKYNVSIDSRSVAFSLRRHIAAMRTLLYELTVIAHVTCTEHRVAKLRAVSTISPLVH